MNDRTVAVEIEDEQLLLHPERAIFWPRKRTVIVADTHFGKGSIFREHGIAIAPGSEDTDRARLRALVEESAAERLFILGDFFHGRMRAASEDARRLESWCESMPGTRVHVVAGNHDRAAGAMRPRHIIWHDSDHREPPFRLVHDADDAPSGELFALSGHIHPVARLRGLRKIGSRVPVFWRRQRGIVLPSFGGFTGGFLVRPAAEDTLYAAAPDRVVPLPARRRTSS
jgi:DNA ligase-associated metallophosphoesterase